MSNTCSTRCTGKSSVCDQCYTRAKSHTSNCRSRIQHLTHSGTTLRSLIADNYYVSGNDLATLDSRNSVFLAVEHTCRTFMYHHLRNYCRTFYHAGIRCDITSQYCNSASLAIWIVNRTDNFRIAVDTIFNILSYRLTGSSNKFCI